VRRPNGSARGAASHQPITNPATGRTTVYVQASTAGCVMWSGPLSAAHLTPCTRPGPVKSQGTLPATSRTPGPPPALPLGEVGDPQPVRRGRGELAVDQVRRSGRGRVGAGGPPPGAAADAVEAMVAGQRSAVPRASTASIQAGRSSVASDRSMAARPASTLASPSRSRGPAARAPPRGDHGAGGVSGPRPSTASARPGTAASSPASCGSDSCRRAASRSATASGTGGPPDR